MTYQRKTNCPKPLNRSALRLRLGKAYFIFKRHLKWIIAGAAWARQEKNILPECCFSHQTPLLRKLKDVDMYLQYNKITNLKLAAARVNQVTLRPGEVFSYWRLIGNPTKRKGYLPGMVLQNGRFKAGIGGGLCQLSNLIYWMALHTPLTVIERHRHGYDVFPDSNRTQPFGSGATCFYNYGDLVIQNNTAHTFQLAVEVGETDLTGAWRCSDILPYTYEVYEKEHSIQHEFWGGYTRHNRICRKKYNLLQEMTEDEFVTENHAIMMYAPFLPESPSLLSAVGVVK